MIERRELRSKALRAVAYDWDNHVLQIEFQSGRVYDYRPVPPSLFTHLTTTNPPVFSITGSSRVDTRLRGSTSSENHERHI